LDIQCITPKNFLFFHISAWGDFRTATKVLMTLYLIAVVLFFLSAVIIGRSFHKNGTREDVYGELSKSHFGQ